MTDYRDESWLREKIEDEEVSRTKLAEMQDTTHKTIMNYCKRYGVGDDLVECPNCEHKSPQLGKHWSGSGCEYPELTQHQKEVLVGILMGDGSINTPQGNQNARFRVDMYEPSIPYLEYLSDVIFPVITTDVKQGETVEQSALRSSNTFDLNINRCHDMYYLSSRRMPCFNQYIEWYNENHTKIWPCEDIKLTPTVLKHYFVGDGHWNNKGSADHITFAMNDQKTNVNSVVKMFERIGFTPSNVKISERTDKNITDVVLSFGKETSYEMFEYMGEPLPSFEYKWPNDYDYDK